MKIKITFYNPIKATKRTVKFVFQWDSFNHCWDVTIVDNFSRTYSSKYSGKPEDFIDNYKKYNIRNNEYISVKSFA